MVYVSRSATLKSGEIAKTMGAAFEVLGKFLHTNRVAPAGPPIAVFRTGDNQNVAVDVGFPVLQPPSSMSSGDVKFGSTPAGRALKAVHHGPYETINQTYQEIAAHIRQNHLPMPSTSWEVYRNDPQTTPPQDLVTEVYFPMAEHR
jgi:AraC family transcriptional regulator